MVGERDCRRFGELGVIASIQPIHMFNDAAWADEELTAEQLSELFCWRRLVEGGAALCGGSDYPIEDPNPWHGIATAVTRLDRKGRAFERGQGLTRQEVLAAYTEGAAWAAGGFGGGRLQVGGLGDWVALSEDPLECGERELWGIEVLGWGWG